MKRLAAAALAALALAALPGMARAQTFTVVPTSLPSAETPNSRGALRLPPAWTERASLVRERSPQSLESLWRSAGAAYGIPWHVLGAINEIETNFGQNMGPSSAGAVGWMQFMPDTWLRWGMDADGDGIADPWNPDDAVYSAARYLAAAGGRLDIRRGIFAYNHADWYVEEVLALSARFGDGASSGGAVPQSYDAGAAVAGDAAFSLDAAQLALEEARREVAVANERLVDAVRGEERLARAEARLRAREKSMRLLSKRLLLQKRAAHVVLRREAARRRVDELRAVLAEREARLREARDETKWGAFAGAVSSTPPGTGATSGSTVAATQLGTNGYVFPVGGGPSIVSVFADHHDYPAADIAAPMGSPVYSLSTARVLSAWHASVGACGIGLTLETTDGQRWTYCHLSYLEPSIRAGVPLAAGAPIGLVGSTGRSTGPHLHLGLRPTTSYPQDQPWFRSFAGVAFRWRDHEPTRPLTNASAAAGGSFAVLAFNRVASDGEVITFTQ